MAIAATTSGAVSVKVRLTRKLAPVVDGVDLSSHEVGDVFELPPEQARLVIAEDWAIAERRFHNVNGPAGPRRRADDRRPDPPDNGLLRAS